jgi:hypothetical protein
MMKIFFPESLFVLLLIIGLLIIIITAGYKIIQFRKFSVAFTVSWLIFWVCTFYTESLTAAEPAGFRMIAIIFVMLVSMKIVVSCTFYEGKKVGLTFMQWIAFSAGWFGMRPVLFESAGEGKLDGGKELIIKGIIRFIAGIFFLMSAHFVSLYQDNFIIYLLTCAFALTGISLILHFGILNLMAGFWRSRGVDARSLFRQPFKSRTLSEFWGKRWNIAFSEMTSLAVYRPLRNVAGEKVALVCSFLFSGFLHTMAISVPVQTAYLLPMIYFLIHGLAMLAEEELAKKGFILNQKPVTGRLWVLFWLLIPLPLLFHKYFLNEIIFPGLGL